MPCQTPADLSITPRDRRFGRGAPMRRWWHSGDPYLTAFYNALSVTFPKGEAFFVDSVRRFREGANPRLAGEIAAFTKQEVMHTWCHATADWGRFKRWRVKGKVMLFVTRNFLVDRTKGALHLLAQDGITGPRAWWGLFRAAFVSPGMMRKILMAWASYFMPGFHPWNHDDRALIASAEKAFGAESLAAAA